MRRPALTPQRQGERSLAELVRQRAFDYLPKMRRGDVFSHESALVLLGCPIRCSPDLHVTTLAPAKPREIRGIIGHAARELGRTWRTGDGLATASPQQALLQASATLPLRELVVAADHLIRIRAGAPITSLDELRSFALAPGRRSVRRLRTALEFARVGSESRMETLLRLILAAYGLDVLELQGELYDEEGGWIGRFDMVDRGRRLIIEYDGEQHRTDRSQYLKDQRRFERTRAEGYRELRLHREDVLLHPHETARRIARFLGLPLRPVSPSLLRELVVC